MYIYWAGQFIKNKLFIAAKRNELDRPRNLSNMYFRDLFFATEMLIHSIWAKLL